MDSHENAERARVNITDDTLSKVKDFLVKELRPYALILFGSSVKGYFREDSDIDVALRSTIIRQLT